MTEFVDDVSTRVAVNVVAELFKKTCDGLQAAESWFRGKRKERDFLGIAARKYATNLEERYSMVRVLGMERPVSLREIYVSVNILDKIAERQRISLETLEKFFDRDQRSFGIKRETKSGARAAELLDRFMVLGKPGAGKTTFLKHLMIDSLDGVTPKKRIPVFVSLKHFSESEQYLTDFIAEQFDICHFPDAAPFITHALSRGHVQLLLDGLDEVDDVLQDFVIKEILRLSDKYRENQYVISCRVASYNHWFETFTDVEIADFSSTQIKQFVMNWFSNEPRIAEDCWKQLSKDSAIRELATVPLLLTLLCLAFDETMDFPRNRAELYRDALDALLKKWDSSRRIRRSQTYKNLSVKRKESMFSRIATETFEEGKYFIPQRVLETKIGEFIQHLPTVSEHNLELDSEGILRAIESHHGILVQRAKGIYSFSHLTFQEYYTAHYIVEHLAEGTLDRLVAHLGEERWREVFLLTTGMLDSADKFFQKLKTRIDQLAEELNLTAFFRKLDSVAESEGSAYPTAFGRCVAVMNVILGPPKRDKSGRPLKIDATTLVQEQEKRQIYLEQITTLIRGVEQELPLNQIPSNVSSRARGRVGELRRALKRARKNPETLHFGKPLKVNIRDENLLRYMKAYQLLFECLGTECYVSRPMRKGLAKGIFALGIPASDA